MQFSNQKPLYTPPLLQPGNKVGVMAPAGKVPEGAIDAAIGVLEGWGLEVVAMPSASAVHGYFAGPDALRLNDLQTLLDSPDIKAVYCARGGYGTSRIIDQVNWQGFQKAPKWVVGFSDITVLHAAVQEQGWQSIHAPTLNVLEHPHALESVRKALFEGRFDLRAPAHQANSLGVARGRLVGGNLCMLAHLSGGPTPLPTNGAILFIEEVGEPPYRVDRHFVQLRRAGLLGQLNGLVVGNLDVTAAAMEDFGQTLAEMVYAHLPANIPVAFGFPIGHIPRNLAVPCGQMATLTVEPAGAKVTVAEENPVSGFL